jgi:hypothetical protein
MTARGRLLGLGPEWTVTNGDVIGFLAYNFAILVFHTEEPKEDIWLNETNSTYLDSLFVPPNLGQYGFSYAHFAKLKRCFELTTYGDRCDPFDPIRKFTNKWNETVHLSLIPGHTITVDESMGLWKAKECRG